MRTEPAIKRWLKLMLQLVPLMARRRNESRTYPVALTVRLLAAVVMDAPVHVSGRIMRHHGAITPRANKRLHWSRDRGFRWLSRSRETPSFLLFWNRVKFARRERYRRGVPRIVALTVPLSAAENIRRTRGIFNERSTAKRSGFSGFWSLAEWFRNSKSSGRSNSSRRVITAYARVYHSRAQTT